MKKKLISLLVCFLLLTGCDSSSFKTITENEANELIVNNAVIIDVRSSQEFDSGHIVNAINIPVEDINSIEYDKETVIIVYCASGVRSASAAKTLVDLGYTNIYNLDGGLINWGATLEQ